MPKIRTRQEATEVQVVVDGKLALNLPWSVALAVAEDMMQKARQAEEIEKAEGIIADNAILFRSGTPFGLSSNPDIISETVKEAQHSSFLRRHMPGGIKSKSIVGRPALYHGKGPK